MIDPDGIGEVSAKTAIELAYKAVSTPEGIRTTASVISVLFRSLEAFPVEAVQKVTLIGVANLVGSLAIHGVFISLWSEYDLLLEVIIKKLTNMSDHNTSIVCTSLQSGSKTQILISLLSHNSGDMAGIDALRKVQEAASRNVYVHGFTETDPSFKEVFLYHREVKNAYTAYTVRKRKKNFRDSLSHLREFVKCVEVVRAHFSITEEEYHNYKKSISDLEPIHASRASLRQRSPTNSKKIRKTQPP